MLIRTTIVKDQKKLKYPWLAKAPVARRRLLTGIGTIIADNNTAIESAQYL